MLDTSFLERCILSLETAWDLLQKADPEEIHHDLYRSACVKEFEIILEQCGKLLRKKLQPYFSSNRAVDALTFKEIFRYASIHGLLDIESVERWYEYRDSRNSSAHDYGVGFAEDIVQLIPQFLSDARQMVKVLKKSNPS